MNSIRVNILGRAYPLRVEAGEEKTMMEIAEYVDERFRIFKSELTTQPEQTIMVLACLSIAEELFSARRTAGSDISSGESAEAHDKALEQISQQLSQIVSDINREN